MILVNVLAMIAVVAAVVVAMLGAETPALDRATTFRDATQAFAIARGGELTAIAALRRDAQPVSDDATEAWAKVAQTKTPIAGGTFALAIADAQGRFNVNAAVGAGEPRLAAIVAPLGLDADVASRISASLAEHGRVRDLDDLTRAGIDDATLARLRPLVTALPGVAPINVNAAPAALLGILVGDAGGGRRLGEQREHTGKLTADDFAEAGLQLPAGAGFTSEHFVVATTVAQGATTVTLTSLLERRRGVPPGVVAIGRWLGPGPS